MPKPSASGRIGRGKPGSATHRVTVLLLARWKQNGAGRVDGKIADGEVTSDLRNAGLSERVLTLTQCWNEQAMTAFQTATPEALRILTTSGDPSLCVPRTPQLPDDDLL